MKELSEARICYWCMNDARCDDFDVSYKDTNSNLQKSEVSYALCINCQDMLLRMHRSKREDLNTFKISNFANWAADERIGIASWVKRPTKYEKDHNPDSDTFIVKAPYLFQCRSKDYVAITKEVQLKKALKKCIEVFKKEMGE